eukprot:sb/3462524/
MLINTTFRPHGAHGMDHSKMNMNSGMDMNSGTAGMNMNEQKNGGLDGGKMNQDMMDGMDHSKMNQENNQMGDQMKNSETKITEQKTPMDHSKIKSKMNMDGTKSDTKRPMLGNMAHEPVEKPATNPPLVPYKLVRPERAAPSKMVASYGSNGFSQPCKLYTGQVCSGVFSQISPRNINEGAKENFINEVSREALLRLRTGNIQACWSTIKDYLCIKTFLLCDKNVETELTRAEMSMNMTCSVDMTEILGEIISTNYSKFQHTSGECWSPMKMDSSGSCSLECNWNAYPPFYQATNSIVTGIALAISSLSCAVTIISYMQISVMKKFPHIIPIYISICSTTAMWFVGIPLIAGYNLYCSTEFLVNAKDFVRSIFCTVQGFTFQYCIIAQSNWFCCMVFNIYKATVSTERFRTGDEAMKKMHINQSIFCWVTPLIFCCIGVSYQGYGNHIGNKQVCVLRNSDMHYFLLVLPVQLTTLLSATLLSFSVFFMKRSEIRSHFLTRKRSIKLGIKPPIHIAGKIEKKLMGLSAAFVALNSFLLTRLTFCMHQRDALDDSVERFTNCMGDITQRQCDTSYTHYLHPEISIVANIAIGVYPLVVLLFLPWNKLLVVLWRKRVFELLGFCGMDFSVSDITSRFGFSESIVSGNTSNNGPRKQLRQKPMLLDVQSIQESPVSPIIISPLDVIVIANMNLGDAVNPTPAACSAPKKTKGTLALISPRI